LIESGGAPLDSTNVLVPPSVGAMATAPRPPSAPQQPTSGATPTATHIELASLGDDFAAMSVSTPGTVAAGRQFTARLTLRNTGRTTWTQTQGYRLTCDTVRAYRPPSGCTSALSVAPGAEAIAPGQAVMFQLRLTAPATPGAYTTWVTMAHGTALFSRAALRLQVFVQDLTPVLQPTSTPTPHPTPTATPTPQPTSTPTPQPTTTPT